MQSSETLHPTNLNVRGTSAFPALHGELENAPMDIPISLTCKLILQFRWAANSSIDRIRRGIIRWLRVEVRVY